MTERNKAIRQLADFIGQIKIAMLTTVTGGDSMEICGS